VYKVNNHTARFRRFLLIAFILAEAFLFSSCHRFVMSAEKRYPFTGRVVSVDSQAQSAIIDGDDIPGFMDAMAMPYKVKPSATLNHLIPGDSISAEVVVPSAAKNDDAAPDYWLENVKVIAHIDPSHAAAANSLHMPAPGEDVPDFSFTDQGGKRISLKQYRGKVLLVTFIYTRCPFPDFCPRVSGNFAEIYRQLGTNPALASTHLLSVSFDPEHDTPKVLRDYGFSVAHTHEPALFSRWEFAAPRAADLPRIADFFALTIKPEGGMITHNLSTAVIGPEGKIVKWYHGSDWQPSDLIKDAAGARAPKG
jgi:protein SCO1